MHAQTFLKATALLAKRHTFAALVFSLALGACGGGGGGGGDSGSPATSSTTSATSSLSQGRWLSNNLTPVYRAIVLPASSGANTPAVDTVWALAEDASRLIKLQINGSAQTAGTVSGKEYVLGTTTVTPITGGSYANTNTNVTQMSLPSVLSSPALFDRDDAMSTALQAAQANGHWKASVGSVDVTWTVQSANTGAAATNNLSGSSTTGCTYSGQSAVVTTQSLYKVQFTETCAGTSQTFKGVATVSADGAHLTVVATNEDATKASALLFTLQL